MNFINAATKKERTHVEEIIKSQPVMPHEGICLLGRTIHNSANKWQTHRLGGPVFFCLHI